MEELGKILEDILAELRALREQGSQQAQPRPFLTIEQVAEMLGLSVKTVRNQLSDGRFPLRPTRIGGRVLFRAADFDKMAQ